MRLNLGPGRKPVIGVSPGHDAGRLPGVATSSAPHSPYRRTRAPPGAGFFTGTQPGARGSVRRDAGGGRSIVRHTAACGDTRTSAQADVRDEPAWLGWNNGEMPQVGFLHTAQVHVSTFEGLVRDIDDSTACLHSVEPDLLDQVRRSGPTVEVEEATLVALEQLAVDGAGVIVCTCSTLGPIAETVGARLPVRVLRVDRPMARAAVQAGSRIAVISALESTLEPTRALLDDEARRAGVSATIIDVPVPEAWVAFESGDSAGYLRQVADAARSIADGVDVVVLAQASMMGAMVTLADLRTAVLASPLLAVEHVLGASSR
jgi:hypothetical protein